jgi:hydrogenase nickel incorporation protein HypB
MCEACGCATSGAAVTILGAAGTVHARPGAKLVDVGQRLTSDNDAMAAHVREHLISHGVLALNLMSSPGAGKTSLLEATIDALAGRLRVAVIEGDLETDNDARRIRAKGVEAIQITTGGACHLDATMVHDAIHALDLASIDVLFIENVGNLVCPAGFDLGQWANVALLSVTEGDDKPAKYPVLFRHADAVLLTKTDLLGAIDDFSPEAAERHVRNLANPAPVLRLSARRPATLTPWIDWLETHRERLSQLRPTPRRQAAELATAS